ncbi:type IV secretion system DNA-binding domain-containing protein [Candidatus Saccharibacteria bacterium]|nr:type IV secretion system DNA-binding domain-containing protein [Candidatus Saccharibacteria bacterium]
MFAQIIHFILTPIVWIPLVALFAFLTYRNYKQANRLKVLNVDSVLLMLEIPRTNDKKELAAEQLFASLHGILRDKNELKNSGGVQEHLSFEIVSTGGQIRFYVWVPKILQSFVEGQIYSQYPTVQIFKCDEDYVDNRHNHPIIYSSELTLTEDSALPIKTFDTFEVDPLAGITGTLAKLDSNLNEELWIQILTRPIADDWHKSITDTWIEKVKSGRLSKTNFLGIDFSYIIQIISALWTPPTGDAGSSSSGPEISERDKTRIAKAEEKATKLGYEVKIRLAYLGNDEINAKLNMQALVGTFKQFNSTNLNGFKMLGSTFSPESLDAYKLRQFTDNGFILNISELASVYHLPHTSVETPNIVWASSKTAEPPAKLPLITGNPANDENISAFGLTNFRGINHQFGLLRRDRSRHVYIIGQTGAGKSGLLELFALSDVFYNQGYCIIDPHGDFAINNLRFIPESRIKDVVYFNPADTAHPVAFNPLELSDPARKPNVSSEVIGVLKRMFGDSWGPRLEHILRYTLLALLDRPETTLLDISRMLTDKDFRKETLNYCKDVTVLQFWKQEFGTWNDKQVTESVAPVLNKVGAFTANPIIRNIIGQPKSSFDVRKIMDEGKILVVNLSKGLIGEDNAGILGAFLVTKVQLAAMSRSDIPDVKDRRPFYLYVDEFQNFATDSFATILSEARKYGLNLTVANQYTAQMTENVRDAVFGNVGTTISFRISADDAPILVKQFEPTFDESDLIQMNNRNFIISMIINGEKVPAFSATTLSIPTSPHDNLEKIIETSREHYSRPRKEVEDEIRETIEASEKYKKELSDSGRKAGEQGTANWNNPSGSLEPKFVFKSANIQKSKSYKPEITRPKTEQKPKRPLTPQEEFKKLKISPNVAEEKEGELGLKDLGKLFAEKEKELNNNTENNSSKLEQKPNREEKNEKKANKKPKKSHKNRTKKPENQNQSKHQAPTKNASEVPKIIPEHILPRPNPALAAAPSLSKEQSSQKISSDNADKPSQVSSQETSKKPSQTTPSEGYIEIIH